MHGSEVIPAGAPVGRYEIVSLLSAGGMGEVYHARDPELQRDLVVKFLPRRGIVHPDARERFVREARAASALNHPNIVTVYEVGETDGGHFIAMELVEGRTLRDVRKEQTSIPAIAKVGIQAARALGVAHAAGIVHRDIKPENVMLREDGYVKVLDFGIAQLSQLGSDTRGRDTRLTQPGMVVGTMRYMSPEQAVAGDVGSPSDIFSLGLVLYELAAGRHPFDASSDMAVLSAIILRDTVPPSRVNSRVPDTLDSILMRMLAKNPSARPTATEVEEAFSSIASLKTSSRPLSPTAGGQGLVVGRSAELTVLHEAFREAEAGKVSMICLSGEPGIGKTTLVEEFLRQLSGTDSHATAMGRCSERLAGAEAYLPLLDAIEDLVRRDSTGQMSQALTGCAPTWHRLIDAKAADDIGTGAQALSQERIKRELAAFLEEVSLMTPLVLLVEDIHWADDSTVDVLGYVLARLRNSRLLAIVTYRPEELQIASHPFLGLKLDLQSRGIARETPLEFLSEQEVGQFISRRFPGHHFHDGFSALVHKRTEGSPLFVEDLLRYLRNQGALKEEAGGWSLSESLPDLDRDIPESMRSMVQRKIGQLDKQHRDLLSAASVQGHTFDSAVIARALGADPSEIEDRLDALERVHSFVRRVGDHEFADGTVSVRYRFVHLLYQNALYASLSTSRRVSLSRAVGKALLECHGGSPGAVAAELGFLFESARDFDDAAGFFAVAAGTAAGLYATRETAVLARRAVALLSRLQPTPERLELELSLQVLLGYAIPATGGYGDPDALAAMARARELAEELEDEMQLDPVMWGLHAYYLVSGDLGQALEIAEQALRLAVRTGDPVSLLAAHTSMGMSLRFVGRLREALEHFEKSIALHDPAKVGDYHARYRMDPRVFCHCMMMRVLWQVGYPDRAAATRDKAVAIARGNPDPRTLSFALLFASIGHVILAAPREALRYAEEAIALCDEHGIMQERGWAMSFRGWAMAQLGRSEEGMADMRASIAIQRGSNAELNLPSQLALLAELQILAVQTDAAHATLAEALEYSRKNGDVSDDPIIYRMLGDLALMDGQPDQASMGSHMDEDTQDDLDVRHTSAEAYYRRSIELAHEQGALSFELKAATRLGELMKKQGRRKEAQKVVSAFRNQFTEGFETPDLVAADKLLEELASADRHSRMDSPT